MKVRERPSLRSLNTFGLDATAGLFLEIDSEEDLLDAPALDPRRDLVLGGGSNVVLVDNVPGAVFLNRLRGIAVVEEQGDACIVEAGGGEDWHALVEWSLARGLGGIENLSLIPGSVGAAPIQNIGAYGVEMRDTFAGLSAIDLSTGAASEFDPAQCCFDYRDSLFKHPDGRRWLILRVRFRLSREPRLHLDYGELREELARGGCDRPTPADVARAVSALRRRKLPDPAVLGNAGSFFKNPVVSQSQAEAMRERFPGLPVWSSASGAKISAAWMIEHCGWKGVREGDAAVHAAHALVLVNHGHATGAQLLALAMRIRSSVMDAFGVLLEPEPLIV